MLAPYSWFSRASSSVLVHSGSPSRRQALQARQAPFAAGRFWLRGGGGRQRFGGLRGEHAQQLAPQLFFRRHGGFQDGLEAVKLQHMEFVDLDVDIDVRLLRLELFAHNGALQDL